MRNNATELLWLIAILVGVFSSLKDKWSKGQNKRTAVNIPQKARRISHENDMEIIMTRSQRHQQPQSEISENTEIDFGEELAGETIGMEEAFWEEEVVVGEYPAVTTQWNDSTKDTSLVNRGVRRSKIRKFRQAVLYHEILSKPKGLR